jgi:hypothetical protein
VFTRDPDLINLLFELLASGQITRDLCIHLRELTVFTRDPDPINLLFELLASGQIARDLCIRLRELV